MLKCDFGGCIDGIEAPSRTAGGNDGDGGFSISSVERLQQVGLFTLRGQSRGWSATLHVDDDERQLIDDSQVDGF